MASRCNRRAGMTLLELIVAMAIFMVIVGALMVGSNNALEAWRAATARSRALGQGRAALGLIRADLLQATVLSNNFELAEDHGAAIAGDEVDDWRSNSATFDRFDAVPSMAGQAAEGRVTWRIEATNNASTLVRAMTYTDGSQRRTEVLPGAMTLRFAPVWNDTAMERPEEVPVNALPVMVDVLLDLVPPQVLARAARMDDETRRQEYLRRHALSLATRVTYPDSRLPPAAALTNMVTLRGRVFDGNRENDTGLAGVSFVVSGGSAVAEPVVDDGNYFIEAHQGARPLRVTPKAPAGRSGRFTPPWLVWRPAAGSRSRADFVWRESDITISGRITARNAGGKPVEGALLDFPMAGQVMTDRNGEYSIGVDQGWPYSGARLGVTPVHPRFADSTFIAVGGSGASHFYENVDADQNGRDYFWTPPDLAITGRVTCAFCRAGLQDVTILPRGGGGGDVTPPQTRTGAGGRYRVTVPYGWSGSLEAKWRWEVAGNDSDEGVGECRPGIARFNDLEESAIRDFDWRPTAVVSGEVWRATLITNSWPIAYTTTLYTNCPDTMEIPGGIYPNLRLDVTNGLFAVVAPHFWYHAADQRRIMYIDPTASLERGLHGVYEPLFAEFPEVPRQSVTTSFTWFPCEIAISGIVTNAAGVAAPNAPLAFLDGCIAIAPTNAVTLTAVTNISAMATNFYQAAIFNETANPRYPPPLTNRADQVLLYGDTAFAMASDGPAFAESLWIRTNENGAFTNWVSYGWSGAIWPRAESNALYRPPAVFIENVTNAVNGVAFEKAN